MKRLIFSACMLQLLVPAVAHCSQWLTLPTQARLGQTRLGQTWQFRNPERSEKPYFRLHPEFEAVIRGQSPQTFQGEGQPGFYDPNATIPPSAPVYGGGAATPYGGPAPLGYDPFTSSPYAAEPLGNPYGFGVVGPQPVRFGWTTHWDSVFISDASMGPGGSVSMFEVDWKMDYVTQGLRGWTWKLSPEFNFTNFNFQQPSFIGLADNYYRFAYRFETTSPQQGPFSWRLGFTPAIATDFQSDLNAGGWNFDADVTMFYRVDPRFLWVLGVSYWDRADDFVLPNAGLVWTPNEFWEIRAVFPKPRADLFVGTPWGIPMWLYAGAEYDVQSWQSGELPASGQIQLKEWRAFAGARWESGYWESYLDFGYAFERSLNVDYGPTSDLSPGDAFMIRAGFQY